MCLIIFPSLLCIYVSMHLCVYASTAEFRMLEAALLPDITIDERMYLSIYQSI
jgi:hypothetical protein